MDHVDPRATDPKNLDILASRLAARADLDGPRVGDWVRRQDGAETRITHHWGDRVQDGGHAAGQFYLLGTGHLSYSGALDPSVAGEQLRLTGETRRGLVWFFDRDYPGAGRGVEFWVDEQVYAVLS